MRMRKIIAVLMLLSATSAPTVVLDSVAVAADKGRLVGCVAVETEQPGRGVASLWPIADNRIPDPRRYIIVPTAVANLKPDGCFELVAPVGSYYVGAILRQTDGATMGPPRPGDLVFMTPALDGSALSVELHSSRLADVGLQRESWRYEGLSAEVTTGVRGRVVDVHGSPVEGLLVFAFADAEVSGTPLSVSERTTEKGLFELRVDRPGKMFLRVKESYGGGAPRPGGYVGIYGGAVPEALQVKSGDVLENVVVEVMRLPEELKRREAKERRDADNEIR